MKKLILVLISMTFLYSCAARDYTYYMNDSYEDLCVSYLTAADYNIHQPARKKAIQVRNLDCTKYVDLARLKIEKEERDSKIFENDTKVCNKVGNTIICQ